VNQLQRVIRNQTDNIMFGAAKYRENRRRGLRVHAAYTVNLNTIPNAVLLKQCSIVETELKRDIKKSAMSIIAARNQLREMGLES
jgi:hypothetical protein